MAQRLGGVSVLGERCCCVEGREDVTIFELWPNKSLQECVIG